MSALVLIQVLLSEDRVNPEGQVQVNPPMVLTQPWEQPDTPSQHSCMSTNKGSWQLSLLISTKLCT